MSRTSAVQRCRENCPNAAKHTKDPEGYLQWHEWAEKKSKTHRQIRCEGCGLYAIWVPLSKAERAVLAHAQR